jgi:hypothetical protein
MGAKTTPLHHGIGDGDHAETNTIVSLPRSGSSAHMSRLRSASHRAAAVGLSIKKSGA